MAGERYPLDCPMKQSLALAAHPRGNLLPHALFGGIWNNHAHLKGKALLDAGMRFVLLLAACAGTLHTIAWKPF